MELWVSEVETEHVRVQSRVKKMLHRERSQYQDIAIVDTYEFGRMLLLDGVVQTTLRDEFIYHEMLAHVPLFTHEHPERVLVIGGGDGGTVREVLKHREVKTVHLVEIDERVVALSRKFLPELAGSLDDPRVEVRIGDGIEYVKNVSKEYDVILIDSSDPKGPAEGLFTPMFYADAAKALRKDGMMAAQTGAVFFEGELVRDTFHAIATAFPHVHLYTANVPTYSVGPFSLTFATKRRMETKPQPVRRPRPQFKTRYYSQEMHRAAFTLPPYIKNLLMSKDEQQNVSSA